MPETVHFYILPLLPTNYLLIHKQFKSVSYHIND